MTSHNIYTPFWASPPPFLGYDARITPSKRQRICTKIEHIYYKAIFDHLLICYAGGLKGIMDLVCRYCL